MASTSLITDLDIINNNKQKNNQITRNSQTGRASLIDFSCYSESTPTKPVFMALSSMQQKLTLPSLDKKFIHKKVPSSQSQTNIKEALKDWLIGKQDVAIEDFIKQGSSGMFYATPGLPTSSKTLLNSTQSSGDTKGKESTASSQLDGLLRSMTTSITISDSSKINALNNNIFSKNYEGNQSNSDQPKRRIISTNRVKTVPDNFVEITDSHSTLDSSVQNSINSLQASNTKLSTARNNLPSSSLIFNSSANIEIVSLQEIRESGRKAIRKLYKKTSLENISDEDLFTDSNPKDKQSPQQQQSQGSAVQSSLSKNTKNTEILSSKPQNPFLDLKPSQFNQIPITNSIQLTTQQLNENSDILTPQSQQSSSFSQQTPQAQPPKQQQQQLIPQSKSKLISSSFGQLKQITLSAHPFSHVSFSNFTEAQQDYSNKFNMRDSFYKQQSLTNLHSATPQTRRSIAASTGNRIVMDAGNHKKSARGILKSKSTLSNNKKSVNFNERVVQYDI